MGLGETLPYSQTFLIEKFHKHFKRNILYFSEKSHNLEAELAAIQTLKRELEAGIQRNNKLQQQLEQQKSRSPRKGNSSFLICFWIEKCVVMRYFHQQVIVELFYYVEESN